MADKKITQLPSLSFISGSTTGYYAGEVVLPIVHNSTTVKIEAQKFALYATQWSATTASNTFIGNQTVNGNVVITGKLTAQEMHTEITSASIIFESGSTIFGNTADDTHTFTGTINVNGKVVGNAPLDFTSQSLNIATGSYNRFYDVTSSVHFTTASLNTQTGSQELINVQNSTVTSSLNLATASLNFTTGALNIASGSYNRFYQVTASVHSTTASLNQATSSLNFASGALNAFTGSFNLISGSYATTGSNTFIGNQNITGSLSISSGQFNVITGSGALTSSLSFRHNTLDPITGNAILELRYKNNDVGPENNAWKFMASDSGVALVFEQEGVDRTLLTSNNAGDALIFRDTRLYGKGLTVDESLLVKGVITGSLLATNGVVSSSNQLFELNQQTGSQGNLNAQIGIATASLNFTTGALNSFTGSILGQNNTISTFTASVNFTTQSLNTQTGSQESMNTTLSIVTGSMRAEIGGIEAYTASLKGAIIVNGTNVRIIGELTASRIYTEFITSSVLFVTGSNIIGDQSSDKHEFTGSVNLQDTLFIKGQAIGLGELNTQTGSQDLVNRRISSTTGSINTTTSSFNTEFGKIGSTTSSIHFTTSSLNTQTGSQDLVNLGISSVTGSLIGITNGLMAFTAALDNTYATDAQLYQLYQATQSLELHSGSMVGVTNGLMNYTASLKGAAIVSSSQQVQNYFTFAKTGSANTFYGNQSISGSLTVNSTGVSGISINSSGDNPTLNFTQLAQANGSARNWRLVSNYEAWGSLDIQVSADHTTLPTSTTRLSLTHQGDLNIKAGNLVMGTSGKGIDFSATSNGSGTMTSELLNDYEEGTWTPVFEGTGGQSGQVYATQDGTYTKVGRLVTFSACVALSTLGTFTNYIKITGLPFTPVATPSIRPVTTVAYNTTITTIPASVVYGANAFMYLYSQSQTSVTSITQLVQADLQPTTVWCVNGFYYTT